MPATPSASGMAFAIRHMAEHLAGGAGALAVEGVPLGQRGGVFCGDAFIKRREVWGGAQRGVFQLRI